MDNLTARRLIHPMLLPFLRGFAALAVLSLLPACGKKQATGAAPGRGGGGAVPVNAAPVVQKEMPVELRAIGNVRPSATVSVKPRVSGLISSVEFKEGQEVKQGDVLFLIDPKPFEVALAQARAALAQVREQAANAQQQARRYSSLGQTGAVAREQLDQFQSTAKSSTSGADAAEAAVREAEIQLSYCTIKSPISGRTGRRVIDAGNVVTANSTELVVVNQIAPIEVVFSVAEHFLSDLTRYMSEGTLKARATPSGEDSVAAEGEITFVDNMVKQASGTVDVKASFANEDRALWPGRLVDVTVVLTNQTDAIVVPTPAVQTGQKGQYVFVVKPDKTVEMRPVEMARTLNNEAVIAKGLAAGESVITDGHVRLFPGAKIEIKPPVGTPAELVSDSAKPATARNP